MEDEKQQQQQKIPLDSIPVTSFPVALNILYQYLNIASGRGAFSLTDSAKIMNCLDFISFNVRPLPLNTDGLKDEKNENNKIKEAVADNKITSGVRKKS